LFSSGTGPGPASSALPVVEVVEFVKWLPLLASGLAAVGVRPFSRLSRAPSLMMLVPWVLGERGILFVVALVAWDAQSPPAEWLLLSVVLLIRW